MQGNLKETSFRVGGMTCAHCGKRIEGALKGTAGVADAGVDAATGAAWVRYDEAAVSFGELAARVEGLDYRVLEGGAGQGALKAAGTLAVVLALYLAARGMGAGAFPLAEAGMGYGMLVVIGLVTSVHCMAMCGGINLSQCIPSGGAQEGALPPGERRGRALVPAARYNAGRVISYTAAGALAGALGSAVTLPGRLRGLVQLAAGCVMVIMGLRMLGVFPAAWRLRLRLPDVFARKPGGEGAGKKGPFVAGLLNGLMPCGPLQAMQIYALSTGSAAAGGLSMFLFGMGTVPLMFGVGALCALLGGASGGGLRRRVKTAGAALITVMGMSMFSYGFGLSGFNLDFAGRALAAVNPFASGRAGMKGGGAAAVAAAAAPVIEEGVQIVSSTLSGGRYPAITVRQGLPVRWIIDAPPGSINGCNNRMIIREYGVEHRFTPGENVIEFTPGREGRFPYSCWMGMIRSSITVVAGDEAPGETEEVPDLAPVPAGVAIPSDGAAVAAVEDGGSSQTVTIGLRDDGFAPSVLVLQRGLPAVWIIDNDSLDPGNRRLLFPAYYARLDMEQGDNVIRLVPFEDFDFSTADNVFYGYVKVVDDLDTVDIEAVKEEAAGHETLIYPDAYFEQANRGRQRR